MKKILLLLLIALFFSSAQAEVFEDIYETPPDVDGCQIGELKQDVRQEVLDYINLIRKIHNLQPVEYDLASENKAMEAALMCDANGTLSHTPPNSWHCYSAAGAEGCQNSNLFIAYSTDLSYLENSLFSVKNWMSDSTVERLGHRRSIINPWLTKFSFGRCDGTPKVDLGGFSASAMTMFYGPFVGGDLSATDLEYVAYPYHNYPTELVKKGWLLSFHAFYDKSNVWNNLNIDYSKAEIEMETEAGDPVEVSDITWDANGGGSIMTALKWRAAGLEDDVKYNVSVIGVSVNGVKKDFHYWFKLSDDVRIPPAPALAFPENGAENVNIESPIEWRASASAETYHLKVYKSEGDALVFEDSTLTETIVNGIEFERATEYYWTVAAENALGKSRFADPFYFTTVEDAPDKPALAYPQNGQAGISITLTFEWNAAENAVSHHIQVAEDDAFDPVSLAIDEDGLTEEVYAVNGGALEYSKDYYWRVRSENPGGFSQWSQAFMFTTEQAGAVYENMRDVLGATAFPNPASNAVTIRFSLETAQTLALELTDYFGETVLREEEKVFEAGQVSIKLDLSKVSPGVYFLKVFAGGKIYIEKIAVAR